MAKIRLVRAGVLAYEAAFRLQEALVARVKLARAMAKDPDCTEAGYLITVEHPPVYTVGLRDRDVYREKVGDLQDLGASYVETSRGGLITFHGPGQLVVYPILNLAVLPGPGRLVRDEDLSRPKRRFLLGMKWYVDRLEQTVIDLLDTEYHLGAHRSPHTGVWLGGREGPNERKICAMGVHNSQLVTSHGLALNCSTDLSWFDHIVPCGIVGRSVTSMRKELGREIEPGEVEPRLLRQFEKIFECAIID